MNLPTKMEQTTVVVHCAAVSRPELLNVQPVSGEAKPYQIRQFLRLVQRYNLATEHDR